jgi:hypothetical protein
MNRFSMSRYIKTDHIAPVKTDERMNYFDPNADPLAGVDASVFDQLSQDATPPHAKPSQPPLQSISPCEPKQEQVNEEAYC